MKASLNLGKSSIHSKLLGVYSDTIDIGMVHNLAPWCSGYVVRLL